MINFVVTLFAFILCCIVLYKCTKLLKEQKYNASVIVEEWALMMFSAWSVIGIGVLGAALILFVFGIVH